jgi:hypothetical protein
MLPCKNLLKRELCRDDCVDLFDGWRGSGPAPHEEVRAASSPLLADRDDPLLCWWEEREDLSTADDTSSSASLSDSIDIKTMTVQALAAYRKAELEKAVASKGILVCPILCVS